MNLSHVADVQFINDVSYYSAVILTLISLMALGINVYLLICSRFLRRPIGVNLRLCVSLTFCDALCSFFYILTYLINVIYPASVSNCWSLLLEVFKLATFFASVFTLLALALNHYVGIVYPLHRHVISLKSVRTAIMLAFFIPGLLIFFMFCYLEGGFQAPVAFDFITMEGCQNPTLLKTMLYRVIIVAPFILFVLLISFLYLHILIYMGRVTKDPLLATTRNKRTGNRKLLVTLMLLAGSACVGWLPTTVSLILFCEKCLVPLPIHLAVYLNIISQLLNVLKLIVDGFIYARRLVEMRYAMWIMHQHIRDNCLGCFEPREIPSEFQKYLSETKEHRSTRSKRATTFLPDSIRTPQSSSFTLRGSIRGTKIPKSHSHKPLDLVKSNPCTPPSNSLQPSPCSGEML